MEHIIYRHFLKELCFSYSTHTKLYYVRDSGSTISGWGKTFKDAWKHYNRLKYKIKLNYIKIKNSEAKSK